MLATHGSAFNMKTFSHASAGCFAKTHTELGQITVVLFLLTCLYFRVESNSIDIELVRKE